jgi:CheY-like chemotaxis protein
MDSSFFEDVIEAADPAPTPGARKRRALVVGAETLLRTQLMGLLEIDGYQAIAFTNGREAREALVANHFDLVVSDIWMPGGEIQVTQLLDWARKKSAARFIQITGQKSIKTPGPQDLSSPDAFERPGVPLPDRLLIKPFKPADLRKAITSCFAPIRGLRQILTLSKPERGTLKEVTLDPDRLASQPKLELLVEAGHGTFELLCAAEDPLPISKIRSLQRLGIRLWTRAA